MERTLVWSKDQEAAQYMVDGELLWVFVSSSEGACERNLEWSKYHDAHTYLMHMHNHQHA